MPRSTRIAATSGNNSGEAEISANVNFPVVRVCQHRTLRHQLDLKHPFNQPVSVLEIIDLLLPSERNKSILGEICCHIVNCIDASEEKHT
jgi:hypothetical protein